MSVVSLGPQNFDYLSLETHPSRSFHFLSSSITGHHNSGSIYVYVDRSDRIKDSDYIIKDLFPGVPFGLEEKHNILSILHELKAITYDENGDPVMSPTFENINELTNAYLTIASLLGVSERKQQTKSIAVHFPKSTFSSQSLAKNLYRKILYKDYKSQYQTLNWAYTNYHCLNFFTGSVSLGTPGQLNEQPIGTTGRFPENSALIYPAHTASISGQIIPRYRPASSFTFSFWINPRYNKISEFSSDELPLGGFWHASTVMHMSSCYAISMVTSSYSERGLDGNPDRFKIMLQLSHSAGIEPSKIDTDNFQNNSISDPVNDPQGLVFLSDGKLKYNNWHHVAITWANHKNGGDGLVRFFIDGNEDTVARCDLEGNCMPTVETNKNISPTLYLNTDALFIGNYYNNTTPSRGAVTSNTDAALFFNQRASTDEGTVALRKRINVDPANAASKLTHPLRAEVHELRIYSKRHDVDYIKQNIMKKSIPLLERPTFLTQQPGYYRRLGKLSEPGNADGIMFYLPPFFRKQVPRARNIKITPFQDAESIGQHFTTIDPFNIELAQRTNVKEISLQNFLQDFVLFETPRCFMLTGSINNSTMTFGNGDGYISNTTSGDAIAPLLGNASGPDNYMSALKGNLTILPCDNGLFRPDWSLLVTQGLPSINAIRFTEKTKEELLSGGIRGAKHIKINSGSDLDKYVSDENILDLSLINISNIDRMNDESNLFLEELQDHTGEEADLEPIYSKVIVSPVRPAVEVEGKSPSPRWMTWRLGDNSSNLVTWFDISNMYYGDRIKRESFTIKGRIGQTVTNSRTPYFDSLPITLKDNGHGSLYRADSYTPHAKWNNVGDILYEEGFAIVKSPHLSDFGRVSFDVDFQGDRKIHVLEIMIPCDAGHFVSSSNRSFKDLRPSDHINDDDSKFVYISSINLHDDNFNVLMRSNLAQPVVKRHEDKLFFRIKVDF